MECGTCGLCCKLLNVPGLAGEGQWCPHAKPGNKEGCCTIHETRPDVCRGYDCAWRLGEEVIKPARCGIVWEVHGEYGFLTALVDKHKTAQLNRRSVRAFGIEWLKKGFFIWFVIGNERHLMLPQPEHKITEAKAHEITKTAWRAKMKDSLLPKLLKEQP